MLRKVPFAIAAPQRLDSRLMSLCSRKAVAALTGPACVVVFYGFPPHPPPALVSTCLNPAWLPSVVYPIHSHGSVFPIANLPRPWRVTLTSRDNGEAEFARGQHVQGGGR